MLPYLIIIIHVVPPASDLFPLQNLEIILLQGIQMSFGTGTTYLATLCGALCTAHRLLQAQGVPSSATHEGFRVAEDICVEVLRGLCVPIAHAFMRVDDHYDTVGRRPGCHDQHRPAAWNTHEPCGHGDCRRAGGVEANRGSGSLAALMALAAGLQHEMVGADTMGADREAVRQNGTFII